MSSFERFREILSQVAHYGFADLLEEAKLAKPGKQRKVIEPPDKLRARNLRLLLQELGPTTIKLGQLLSTRPDLLGPDYIRELENLQDEGPKLPYSAIRQVIFEEIGPPELIFEEIAHHPIAAASLAQVHYARLRCGQEVALKVQRPGVAEQVAQDLPVLYRLASVLARYSSYAEVFDFEGIIAQLERSIRRELDFCFELASMERIRLQLRCFKHLLIPRTYSEYSNRRLLTMQYIRGSKVTEGMCYPSLAIEILQSYAQQVALDGYYHADPHPGNVLITENGCLALLDFGMIGVVDARTRRGIAQMLLAVVNQDGARVAEELQRLGEPTQEFELANFQREISTLLENYQFSYGHAPNIGELMVEMIRKSTIWHLKAPPEFTMLSKSLMQVDDLARKLDPKIDPSKVIGPQLEQAIWQSLQEEFEWPKVLSSITDTVELLTNTSRRLNILGERLISEDKIRFQFEHIGLDGLYTQLGRVGNRLSVAIIIAALLLFSGSLIQQPPPYNYIAAAAGIFGLFLTLFVFVTVSNNKEF